jgi:hypothetical protein
MTGSVSPGQRSAHSPQRQSRPMTRPAGQSGTHRPPQRVKCSGHGASGRHSPGQAVSTTHPGRRQQSRLGPHGGPAYPVPGGQTQVFVLSEHDPEQQSRSRLHAWPSGVQPGCARDGRRIWRAPRPATANPRTIARRDGDTARNLVSSSKRFPSTATPLAPGSPASPDGAQSGLGILTRSARGQVVADAKPSGRLAIATGVVAPREAP